MEKLVRRAFNSPTFRENFLKGVLGASYQYQAFSTKGQKKSKSKSDKSNVSKKEIALQQALDDITKEFGKGSITWLGRSATPRQVPVVSTGSISLDVALGIGGFPKGRVIEVFGPEASGKTTLALHVISEAQKHGGYCAFIDADHALDPAIAESIGVNTQNWLLSQPDSGEQALSLVDTLIKSGSVDVVVVDSVPALFPKGELDGEMLDAHMLMQGRSMSQALRKLSHSLSKSQCVLLFLNQARDEKSTFPGFRGPTDVTCGGNALKYYASVRLDIRRTGLVKKGEETIGSQVLVKVIKNKHAPPFRTAEFELEIGKGICRDAELINLGVKHKLIKNNGIFYYLNGENFPGKDALRKYLSENSTLKDELALNLEEKLLCLTQAPENEVVVSAAEGLSWSSELTTL